MSVEMDVDEVASRTYDIQRESGTVRHKALSEYYSHLFTLEGYLSSFDALLYHSDPDEYRKLVKGTICAPRTTLSVPLEDATYGTQKEAVDRILDDLQGRGDVLLNGSKNGSYGGDWTVSSTSSIRTGNTSSLLFSDAWRMLRSRLGDAAFRHLFLHTSIFLPLGNNCYMQLCGPPVYDMYDSTKRSGKRKSVDEGRGPDKRSMRGSAAAMNLSRHRMYYGRPPRTPNGKLIYGLPKTHILNKVTLGEEIATDQSLRASMSLIIDIFPCLRNPSALPSASPWDRVKGNKRRVEGILPVMYTILLRHRKLDYQAMLRRCLERLEDVDFDAYRRDPGREDERQTAPKATSSLEPVSQSQVCRFATSVLRALLTTSVLGSEGNFQVITNRARTLVRAKMHEPISLHSLVQDLRVNDFTWLALGDTPRVPPQEAAKRRQLVEQFVYWVFEHFLIPLLRASFHATETATTRYEVVYYSHETWARLTEPHLQKLQGELLEQLDESQLHLSRGLLGASSVRLIPKPAGFRPIVNLGRAIAGNYGRGRQKGQSANQVLRGVHQVLTFEKNRKRASLGSCLFGTNEIFAPLRDLKNELLQQRGQVPKLYFVKMDIKSAFDTIKQDKVLEVIDKLLDKNHDYCLMLYCLLLPPASKATQASARRLFKTRAVVADECLVQYSRHAENMAEPLRNAVIVDLFRRQEITREAVMDLLRTHIQQNVWQIGDQYFRQKTGIPQGSKISSLLCSFFYSFMEAEHLSWTTRLGTRLLRYIDDFLLITDDYTVARRFVHTMSKGFPEYGAFISPSKTLLSFELAPGGQAAPVVGLVGDGRCYFPYCGFLIDVRTLDFSIDLGRLMAGPTRQSFALRTNRRRGSNFVGWLSRQLENRNHVAYLDTDHNSFNTVYLNIVVNFAHTALKIPHYFGNGELDPRRSLLVYSWLCLAAEYTYSAGRARVRHASRGSTRDHFTVSRKVFLFLAKSAMYLALSRRPSRFARVIDRLKKDLDSRENRGVAVRMDNIVDQGWKMLKRHKA